MSGFVQKITNPVEALKGVGKENSQLHEDLRKIQAEHYHFVKCLQYISEMPNEAAPVALKGLQLRPFK